MRPVRENMPHGFRRSVNSSQSRPGRRVANLNRRIAARPSSPTGRASSSIGLLILVTAGLGVVNPILIRIVFDSALFVDGGP